MITTFEDFEKQYEELKRTKWHLAATQRKLDNICEPIESYMKEKHIAVLIVGNFCFAFLGDKLTFIPHGCVHFVNEKGEYNLASFNAKEKGREVAYYKNGLKF